MRSKKNVDNVLTAVPKTGGVTVVLLGDNCVKPLRSPLRIFKVSAMWAAHLNLRYGCAGQLEKWERSLPRWPVCHRGREYNLWNINSIETNPSQIWPHPITPFRRGFCSSALAHYSPTLSIDCTSVVSLSSFDCITALVFPPVPLLSSFLLTGPFCFAWRFTFVFFKQSSVSKQAH